jgi:hypothetical protein
MVFGPLGSPPSLFQGGGLCGRAKVVRDGTMGLLCEGGRVVSPVSTLGLLCYTFKYRFAGSSPRSLAMRLESGLVMPAKNGDARDV